MVISVSNVLLIPGWWLCKLVQTSHTIFSSLPSYWHHQMTALVCYDSLRQNCTFWSFEIFQEIELIHFSLTSHLNSTLTQFGCLQNRCWTWQVTDQLVTWPASLLFWSVWDDRQSCLFPEKCKQVCVGYNIWNSCARSDENSSWIVYCPFVPNSVSTCLDFYLIYFPISVLGTIKPDELGVTLTHEHLCIDYDKAFFQPWAGDHDKTNLQFELKNLGWIRQFPLVFVCLFVVVVFSCTTV